MGSWLTSQVFRLPSDVAPGQTAQVAVHVTAPRVTAPLYLEAELFKNQQLWFPSFQPVAVSVGAAKWSAGFDLTGIPAAWSAGQTQWFTVYAKNTGTAAWTAGGAGYVALDLHFTPRPGGSSAIGGWLTSQVFRLTADVAPGQTAQVGVRVTAPSAPGPIYLEAEMFKNQQLWFPTAQPVPVSVAVATWWASADLTGAPLVWSPGQTQAFAVFLRNTGNELWPAGGANAVELDLHFTSPAGGWVTNQAFHLTRDIRPGDADRFVVSVTAPPQPGSYILEAEMFKNQQFWFVPRQQVAVTAG